MNTKGWNKQVRNEQKKTDQTKLTSDSLINTMKNFPSGVRMRATQID